MFSCARVLLEVGVEVFFPDCWVPPADPLKLTEEARLIVHRPASLFGPPRLLDLIFRRLQPLLQLCLGTLTEAALEAGEADGDLSGVDDYTAYRDAVGDLAGDAI